MDPKKLTPKVRNSLFRAMTGRGGDVTAGASLTDKLRAAFGPGPRGAVVNAKAAAEALGVSTRTVQRWVKGEIRNPKADHVQAITKAARQAASTKAGRKAALAVARDDRASKRGATLTIKGRQGPLDYERHGRSVTLDLDPSQVRAMRDAWEAGGDNGVLRWTSSTLDQDYVADWNIVSIDDIRFTSK